MRTVDSGLAILWERPERASSAGRPDASVPLTTGPCEDWRGTLKSELGDPALEGPIVQIRRIDLGQRELVRGDAIHRGHRRHGALDVHGRVVDLHVLQRPIVRGGVRHSPRGVDLSLQDTAAAIVDRDTLRCERPATDGPGADKVVTVKYKRRKGYRKKIGHRQQYTAVKITGINL